jgi:phenylacetate-CoA ligase
MTYFDALETRSADQREAEQLAQLRAVIGASVHDLSSLEDLQKLPVLRKSDLTVAQAQQPPFGNIATQNITHLFQSPGPINEPGGAGPDWWRFGRFLHATGIGSADVVQNTFSYHFTPAGKMFESAALAVGARVFAAGTGQTAQQVQAASAFGVTTYAGTPDFLGIILTKADELNIDLSGITKAAVSGGPLFPAVRQGYADRGITCLQCYATADVGLIAYETIEMDGMILDEGIIVEIVVPGTGLPVSDGEIGEVLVTSLNPDYPLVRFATGDMSSYLSGQAACGRTNRRISGWKGRADQAAKVKGMFIRPEQVARLLMRHPEISKARAQIGHDGSNDTLVVKLETNGSDTAAYKAAIADEFKLKAEVIIVNEGSLPRDGVVIEDQRDPS